jgi:hypothetical protein
MMGKRKNRLVKHYKILTRWNGYLEPIEVSIIVIATVHIG